VKSSFVLPLLLRRLSKAHAWSAALFVDELDVGDFLTTLTVVNGTAFDSGLLPCHRCLFRPILSVTSRRPATEPAQLTIDLPEENWVRFAKNRVIRLASA
jgi:hypothetical protein